MRVRSSLAVLLLTVSMSAHAAFKLAPAPPDNTAPAFLGSNYPDKRTNVMAYKIPDSYYGVSVAGKGSALPVLLFGPLGALANAASITSASKRAAENPLFSADIPEIFHDLGYMQFSAVPSEPHYQLTPAVGFLFNSENSFAIYCNLKSAFVIGGREQWHARYMVQDEDELDRADPDLAEKLQTKIRNCYAKGTELFEMHRRDGNAEFVSNDIVLVNGKKWGLPVHRGYLPSRLIYRDDLGLYELHSSRWLLPEHPAE